MEIEACGAGEETREPTDAERQGVSSEKQHLRRHVQGSFGKDTYHTLCHGADCEGSKDVDGLSAEDRAWLATQPPEARYLIEVDVAFIGCDHQHDDLTDCKGQPHSKVLCLNMNDTFFYACGDGEEVKEPERMVEVVRIYKAHGPTGLTCWVAKQRGFDPCVEYTEDPVYQATWRALYGDLKLEANPMLVNNPAYRWSAAKLGLKAWAPLP